MEAVEGERVVLARKKTNMARFEWTGSEPDGLYDLEEAEELGARWEGDELVTYDLPGFSGLYEYYRNNDYLIDND
jgi:predicted alpha/beta-fold hydrolase